MSMRYFDLHCDTITECMLQEKPLYQNDLFVSIERAKAFRPWAQVFAIWIPDTIRGQAAWGRFEQCAAVFEKEIAANQDKIRFCKSGKDLKTAVDAGLNAAFLSIEGGAALNGSLENLRHAYEKGVRLITLTWNGENELGDGCRVENAGGLTPFGREVVREMAKRKMIIDVSHLSEKGFYDVAQQTDRPFVASHSNAFSVCGNARNLTNAQIQEIIRRNGLIGINLYPNFIKESGANLADLLPHIGHILALAGEKVLSVGADFDGADMPAEVRGIEDIAKLYELLCGHFGETLTDAIFYRNAFDFFAKH